MSSPLCERAIEDATLAGNAILKFISPNDVGLTGSHQCGFYLPKSVWQMYSPFPPAKETLNKHPVTITWPDGRVTNSVVTWYGQKSRREYRLTRFGRDFPWLTFDTVGDLLVLVPQTIGSFSAYVFDLDEDIEDVQAALGVEQFEKWGVYRHGAAHLEDVTECVDRRLREVSSTYEFFPSGEVFSEKTWETLRSCSPAFAKASPDETLMICMELEYKLFRMGERLVCQSEIVRLFRDIDDFLQTGLRILNRRKARAGRSLENHIHRIFSNMNLPHDIRPDVDGRPDIVIPGRAAYLDTTYPLTKLFVIGVKTTCKDRWRQVLNEGKRQPAKFILTTQRGISANQLREMSEVGVQLVVPESLHGEYPPQSSMKILTIQQFIDLVFSRLA